MTGPSLLGGVSAGALALALTCGAPRALAQTAWPSDAPPPIAQSVDANGVDVISGSLILSVTQASIGPQGAALVRSPTNFSNEDNFYGAINSNGSLYTVSIGGSSETFTGSPSAGFSSQQNAGSSLSYNSSNGDYTYTQSDGTVAIFDPTYATAAPVMANVAQIVSLRRPTGETLTYQYHDYMQTYGSQQEPLYRDTYWIQRVSSNRGQYISYGFSYNGTAAAHPVLQIVGGFNNTSSGAVGANFSFSGSQVTDPLGRVTNYGTVAPSSTQTITLPSGETRTVVYDSSSRVTSYFNGVGTWNYSYAPSGSSQTTTVTDPNGNTKTYISNTTLDVLTRYTDALGRVTNYGYDSSGRMTSVTRPFGDTTQYTYDEGETSQRGNVTTTTWIPSNGGNAIITRASFDASCGAPAKCNKPNSTTDGKGNVTTYTYDNTTGVLLSVTKPAGGNNVQPQTRYSYSSLTAAGQNSSIYLLTGVSTCNLGSAPGCIGTSDETRTTIAYDPNHNLAPLSVTVAAGDGSISSTQSFAYDGIGNLIQSTNPLNASTTYFYDADRELTGVVAPDPDGSGPRTPVAARISYTADGKVSEGEVGTVNSSSMSDFANFSSALQTLNQYDSADRLVQVAHNDGGAANTLLQMSYDNANRLICSAERMNVPTFGSEPGQCTLGVTGPDGPDRITARGYDASDALTSITTGYGLPGQSATTLKNYGNNGVLTSVVDANSNTTCYGYDGFGRHSSTQYPNPSAGQNCNPNDFETLYYDGNSNLTNYRRRDGSTITYSYNGLNLLTSDTLHAYAYDNQGRVTDADNSSWGLKLIYDALGRKTQDYNSFGGHMYLAYDAAGHRTGLTWSDGFSANYSYDLTGNVLQITEGGATSGVGVLASYGYDSLGRRASVSYGSGVASQTFGYDNFSRLATWSLSVAGDSSKNDVINLDYSPSGQIVMQSGSNGIYDHQNPTGEQFYGIDGLNRVSSARPYNYSYDAKGNLTSDGVNSFAYAADNTLSGANSASFSYDNLYRLAQTSGSQTTRFTYDGSTLTDERDGNNNLLRRYVPGPDGRPLVWYEGSSVGDKRWLMQDQHGSVMAVVNGSGALGVNTYDDQGIPGPSNLGRFQYAGYPFIPEAGLYATGPRAYSPTLGRFLQTDPIGYGDGMNWYAYTHNDPVNNTDQAGLAPDPVGVAIGLGYGAVEGFLTAFTTPGATWQTYAVDVGGGLLLGGLAGAIDPTDGLLLIALGNGGIDLAGQATTKDFNGNYNFWEAGGTIAGGLLGAGVGASALKIIGKKGISAAGGFAVGNALGLGTAPWQLFGGPLLGDLNDDSGSRKPDLGTTSPVVVTGHPKGKSTTVTVPRARDGGGASITSIGGIPSGYSGDIPDFPSPSINVCVPGFDC